LERPGRGRLERVGLVGDFPGGVDAEVLDLGGLLHDERAVAGEPVLVEDRREVPFLEALVLAFDVVDDQHVNESFADVHPQIEPVDVRLLVVPEHGAPVVAEIDFVRRIEFRPGL
jgi:hypothetical protein